MDDCRVVATMGLVDMATLGAVTLMPSGKPMSELALARMARAMRATLDKPGTPVVEKDVGGLNQVDAVRMVARYFGAGITVKPVNERFVEVWHKAGEGFAYTVSGDASGMDVPSALRRTAVPHEILLIRTKPTGKALVADPYHPSGGRDWVTREELRLFAAGLAGAGRVLAVETKVGHAVATQGRPEQVERLQEQLASARAAVQRGKERCNERVAVLQAQLDAQGELEEYVTGFDDAVDDVMALVRELEPRSVEERGVSREIG